MVLRRVGVLAGLVLAGGLWAATTTAAPMSDHVHLAPAPTSVDHAPFCTVPDAPGRVTAGPGQTLVTFTVLPAGC